MAQPTKPGNVERGWNDPPVFLHSPSLSNSIPGNAVQVPIKRTPLTKRVAAYPGMYGGGTTGPTPPISNSATPPQTGEATPVPLSAAILSSECSNIIPPPPKNNKVLNSPSQPIPGVNQVILLPPASSTDLPMFTAPIIVPTMSPQDTPLIATNPVNHKPVIMTSGPPGNDDLTIPDFDDDDQLFHFVLTRLYRVLSDCKSAVSDKVAEEVSKKLEILSAMWKDGKISYPVKSTMAQLATALHTRKCDRAHDLHLGLMMDNVSEVGQWMVGIKRLIYEARRVDPPCSPTDCTASMPNLITTETTSEPTPMSVATTLEPALGSKASPSEDSSSNTQETPDHHDNPTSASSQCSSDNLPTSGICQDQNKAPSDPSIETSHTS